MIPFWIYCAIYLELLGIYLLFRDLLFEIWFFIAWCISAYLTLANEWAIIDH